MKQDKRIDRAPQVHDCLWLRGAPCRRRVMEHLQMTAGQITAVQSDVLLSLFNRTWRPTNGRVPSRGEICHRYNEESRDKCICLILENLNVKRICSSANTLRIRNEWRYGALSLRVFVLHSLSTSLCIYDSKRANYVQWYIVAYKYHHWQLLFNNCHHSSGHFVRDQVNYKTLETSHQPSAKTSSNHLAAGEIVASGQQMGECTVPQVAHNVTRLGQWFIDVCLPTIKLHRIKHAPLPLATILQLYWDQRLQGSGECDRAG